eukprot:CAMPEP_0204330150 /NCGR_PEP_ID=MMETSP0469-20131031/14696_1 /ASSEMBLY_ACC=CAM_ASM_000384 /TAXON_ID=2969 /ORGANISM="Oxyrrhis marina" /LENGTH=73 /DNA_ID=CAMNT_0051312879 /DNA_START=11 /DNA_END=232 /DNA_ORIENTATION=+
MKLFALVVLATALVDTSFGGHCHQCQECCLTDSCDCDCDCCNCWGTAFCGQNEGNLCYEQQCCGAEDVAGLVL